MPVIFLPGGKSMNILIIDDEPDTVEPLTAFLTQNGHQVSKSYTAQEGLKTFTLELPDAVFLDIILPDKNGIELLKEIKIISRETPVIMITGYKDAEKVIHAFREGAFDCLLKPFNLEYLKNDILPRIPLRNR